jgi:glycosyltransferase involved in cell wall biosynthesis
MKTAWPREPAAADLYASDLADVITVAVIIPTFNHAHFLADAIASVLAQTRQAEEIIVVDDGSTDDPARVAAKFPTVRLIRQDNRGLSAARNTGMRNCKTNHIIFLDADDRLLPTALQSGLTCAAAHPECAFIYGGSNYVSEDGHPLWSKTAEPINGDAFLAFLRRNQTGGIMTVVFRRDCLLALNGFDETLRRGEDYDLYLRMTQKYQVASHQEIVAEYRRHDQNMSNDHAAQLKVTLLILDRQEARIKSDVARAVLREARVHIRRHYVSRMLGEAAVRWRARRNIGILVLDLIEAALWSPHIVTRTVLSGLGGRSSKMLLRSIAARAIKKNDV